MEAIRNERSGYTELWKGGELFGISFSIEELWKLRVYVTFRGDKDLECDYAIKEAAWI